MDEASATHGSHAPCLHLLRSRRTLQLLDADSKHTPKAAKRELAQRTDLVARKGERAEAMVERYLVGYDEHVRAKLMHLKKRELLALYAYTERTETWKALEAIFAGL